MFQQKLAVVKSLSLEEEKIVGSDWADLFRVDIKESGMASALASLDSASSGFIRLASASNAVQVQHPNVNWSTVMQEVPKLVSQEFDHVFKRWSSCLIKAEARLEGQRPRGWLFITILSGLMSRCTMPNSWQCCSAEANSFVSL